MLWPEEDRVEVLEIDDEAPPTTRDDHWPCLRCRRTRPIRRMRRVRVRSTADLTGSLEAVLLCEECVEGLAPMRTG